MSETNQVVVPTSLVSVLIESALRNVIEVWRAEARIEAPRGGAPMGALALRLTLPSRLSMILRYRLGVSCGRFRLEQESECLDPALRFHSLRLLSNLESALSAAVRQVAGMDRDVLAVEPGRRGLEVRYSEA